MLETEIQKLREAVIDLTAVLDKRKVLVGELADVLEESTPAEVVEKPAAKKRASKKKDPEPPTITLDNLRNTAMTLAKLDRKLCKDIVSKYADTLTDVSEDKYAELNAEFEASIEKLSK